MWGDKRFEFARVGGVPIVRLRDPQSPAIRGFTGIPRFAVDLKFRVDARVVRTGAVATQTYPTGAVVPVSDELGLEFELDGPRRLVASMEGGKLFVLFADATNGTETYEAGRFVYVTWDGGDAAVLDFNQAFNPPCALTEFATCPVVPAENRLPLAIRAGERSPVR